MGSGTTGVENPVADKPAREIEREIEDVRTRLDKSLAELDRRRHELTDVKLQIQRHPEVLYIAGGVAVLLLGGVYLAVRRAQKREEPMEKARRFRRATHRAIEHPEKVARGDAPVWEKIMASVGTTVAVAVTKRLLDRAMPR
ncbi:MAG TPA: hypothetical protein VGH20_13080 [Myxococcales bacterium]